MLLEQGSGKLPQAPEISVIDDDASVRTAVSRLVRSLGYVANTFASAEEFLNSAQLDRTTCLIADVQMPHMSGLELQDLLRRQARQLPIIFITAFPEPNIKARAMNGGGIGFLAKPIDGDLLIKHIHAAVAKTKIDPTN
jgi:FixJ family two-component response regulator